jgi:HAD superfamily hydrolase (TIGR01450 family)
MQTCSFAEIAARYPVIFFDAYGVLKNYRGVLSGVPEVIAKLEGQGKDIFIVTNDASKSPEIMARAYVLAGHEQLIRANQHVTSGMLVTDWLSAKVRSGRVAYLGKPESAYYIESAGLTALPIATCSYEERVEAIVLLDDEGFDWQPDLNRALNMLRRHNVPVVIANADPTYPVNPSDVAVAVGSLGDLLEGLLHKRFIRFGKPDAIMFYYAFERALITNPSLRRQDILMVGDTLETDILGGNKFGIDTALVLSGNTSPDDAETQIRSTGIIPDYVCASILT